MLAPCFCGPAGWSYPKWNATVYPRPRPRGFHPLEYLAGFFDVVEINTSFYQNLRPELARLWLRKIESNPRFQFTVKLNRRFTHERVLVPAETAAFKEGLWPLTRAGRLAGLLMQFPASFRFTSENRRFLLELRRAFHEFPLAAEMRHGSWTTEEAVGTFMDARVGFCNVDEPGRACGMPRSALLTTGVGYVRLHGRAADSTGQGSNYLYQDAELDEWKERIDQMRRFADAVIVVFNNNGGGKAVVNALEMQARLGRDQSVAPSELVRRYPFELAGFRPDRATQSGLFGSRAVA